MIDGHAQGYLVGEQLGSVVVINRCFDDRIVPRHIGSDSQRGRDNARSSRARAARAAAGSSCTGSTTTAHAAAARSALHHAGVYAARYAACLGKQNVSLRNGDVVARDDHIEIVFESKINGVTQ